MQAWWTKPMRAVTLEFPASDVSTIDVVGIVDELHRGAVNLICVFATGYYPGGSTFYQSKIAPHYPGLGERDLLADAVSRAHQHGQKAVAYIASIWGGRDLFNAHPDWAQRHADGTVTSWDDAYTTVAMCPNSPYREYLASIVREIADNYDVDGFYFDEPSFQSWCNCSYCQDKFYREFHQPLPTREQWDDPVFQKFLQWRYRQISSWRQELCELGRRQNRGTFVQGAFPLSFLVPKPIEVSGVSFDNPYLARFGVPWYVPLAHAADLAQSARAGDLLHFELYRRSVHEPLWWYGVSMRYGQDIAQGKQILVLNMMAQSPFDLIGLPEAELRLSVAELIANSGSPLFARYYPDRVDQKGWDTVYECLREAAALEPYLIDRDSAKYAAILYSQATVDRFDHEAGKPSHLACMKGFAKALLQGHILFDIVTEENLAEKLGRYKVLILPNAACLSSASKAAIREFAARGGGVVASYESGMYDELGRRTPEDDLAGVLKIAYGEEPAAWSGFDVYMQMGECSGVFPSIEAGQLVPTGGVQVPVVAAGAEVLSQTLGGAAVHYGPMGELSGVPAITMADAGEQGRAVFIAPALGNRYGEFGVPAHRELMVGTVLWAAGEGPQVCLEKAPQTMALTAFEQAGGERLIIHLVNSVRDEMAQAISQVAESSGMRIQVATSRRPKKVMFLPEGRELDCSLEDGILSVEISTVRYHCLVVLEF